MVEDSLIKLVGDFLDFFLRSVSDVPLEISVGSATILTFIWVVHEIFGHLSFLRIVCFTIWGLVLLDFYTPVESLGREQVWFVVLVVGLAITVVEFTIEKKLSKGKIKKCPHCGGEISEGKLKPAKSSDKRMQKTDSPSQDARP